MKVENSSKKENSKNTPVENLSTPKEQPKKHGKPKFSGKKTGFQSMLKQIGMVLLFLAIGALVVILAVYLPTMKKLQTAQNELERLIPIETQYIELQESHDKAQTQAIVYKLMSDTSRLEEALANNATERITQYLIYIEDDLSELIISESPELPSSLTAQFGKIKSSISSNRTTAIDDLQDFYDDLLLLADNL